MPQTRMLTRAKELPGQRSIDHFMNLLDFEFCESALNSLQIKPLQLPNLK